MGKKISVTRKHTLGPAVANEKLIALTSQFAEKYGAKTKTVGERIEISGKGFEGFAIVTGESVTLTLELGFLLGAVSGKIEEGVVRQLEKHFA